MRGAIRHAWGLDLPLGTQYAHFLGGLLRGDLGQSFGASLTEAEVRYLMSYEWACTAADIVWRRSKLGLRLTPLEIAAIDDWISTHRGSPESPLLEAGGRA